MKTRIVCHRGACRHAPENTIASGTKAAELGGDIVELDVRQSKDGVLYLLHDATIDRTTNGSGRILDLNSSAIDQLDAGSWFAPTFHNEPLPRLDQFFAALRDRVDFYIEVKAADAQAVAAAILDAGIQHRCFTYSESAAVRRAMVEAAPWLKHMVNVRDIQRMDEVRSLGASILEFHARDFDADGLREARRLGLEIMVHTPHNDEAIFRRALEAEVDYLNIDFPDVAARLRSEIQ